MVAGVQNLYDNQKWVVSEFVEIDLRIRGLRACNLSLKIERNFPERFCVFV